MPGSESDKMGEAQQELAELIAKMEASLLEARINLAGVQKKAKELALDQTRLHTLESKIGAAQEGITRVQEGITEEIKQMQQNQRNAELFAQEKLVLDISENFGQLLGWKEEHGFLEDDCEQLTIAALIGMFQDHPERYEGFSVEERQRGSQIVLHYPEGKEQEAIAINEEIGRLSEKGFPNSQKVFKEERVDPLVEHLLASPRSQHQEGSPASPTQEVRLKGNVVAALKGGKENRSMRSYSIANRGKGPATFNISVEGKPYPYMVGITKDYEIFAKNADGTTVRDEGVREALENLATILEQNIDNLHDPVSKLLKTPQEIGEIVAREQKPSKPGTPGGLTGSSASAVKGKDATLGQRT